ncbi:unnamed protein product [Nyctereutes procyonoides]|uniref:(raccoon dog) hypothetical protein n=1 Tax=Nyctereutes procyonoides TaxID=34880 RepID=A0A811YVY5_NYCPR|nr:unnamed protein product [Nyctereutes procyonoides]
MLEYNQTLFRCATWRPRVGTQVYIDIMNG